jgi:hypothetical protein
VCIHMHILYIHTSVCIYTCIYYICIRPYITAHLLLLLSEREVQSPVPLLWRHLARVPGYPFLPTLAPLLLRVTVTSNQIHL